MSLKISMATEETHQPKITVVGVGGAGGNAVQNMIEIHRDGAYETGVARYVNNWPSLDSIRILDHEDDITPLEYEPFDYSLN